jgi:hypothetical protein
MTLWCRNSTKSLPSLYVKLWWIITILIIIEKTSSSAIVISRCSVNDELALKKMMAFSFERSKPNCFLLVWLTKYLLNNEALFFTFSVIAGI